MATKINIRSPYYIKTTNALLTSATLSLYVYEGTFTTDKPASAQYTLTKTPIGSNTYVVFEIAELVRDYITNTFDGIYTSNNVWVEADIVQTLSSGGPTNDNTDYIAYDGYLDFEDGANTELTRGALISNSTIYRLNDSNVRIPVDTEGTNSISFRYQGVDKRTQSISSSTSSSAQVDYITVSGSDNSDTFQERILEAGGVFEDNPCIQYYLNLVDIGLIDEIWVNYDTSGVFTGSSGTSTENTKTDIIKIETVDECKYTPYKVTFINKFGVLQDIWFFKKSVESINTKSDSYKSNTLDLGTLSYSFSAHQYHTFNNNGRERITMNTGFISEEYNEVFKQLLLSEQVWMTKLTDEELVIPITPITNSLTYKTSVNDKLVDYTIEFEYAFDSINNIR